MEQVKAVGVALYAYTVLEERLEAIWQWVEALEDWSGRRFAEYYFNPRNKDLTRAWKATKANRARLSERLASERPWSQLRFGWPDIRREVRDSGGMQCYLLSVYDPARRSVSFRGPSLLALVVHPDALEGSRGGVAALLELAASSWKAVDAAYGFIDVETGIPLQDDVSRNMARAYDSRLTDDQRRELYLWQTIGHHLDRRVWKAFWGNLLGPEHLRRMGGIEDMQRADRLRRVLPEYLERAYVQGKERLRSSGGYSEWRDLSGGGVLLTLSGSPLDWLDPAVQARRADLQQALGRLALGPWDLEDGLADIAMGKTRFDA